MGHGRKRPIPFFWFIIIDELVESREALFLVIPAEAGIQSIWQLQKLWTLVFTGVTPFCKTIIIDTVHQSSHF
jgi:hypothetical protein